MKKENILFPLLIFLFTFFPKTHIAQPNELIPQITIQTNELDSIFVPDLFYSDDYNISFKKNKNINIIYNKEQQKLYLLANNFEGITFIEFSNKNSNYAILLHAKNIGKHKFILPLSDKKSSVYLFGSFNNWNRSEFRMEKEKTSNEYSIEIPLEAGVYEYKYFVNGKEILDPTNNMKVSNGLGGENSQLIIEDLKEKIYLHIVDYVISDSNVVLNYFLEKNSKMEKTTDLNILSLIDNQAVDSKYVKVNGNMITIKIPNSLFNRNSIVRTQVQVNNSVSNIQTSCLAETKLSEKKEFKWYDGIIYSLMVDRFKNGDISNDSPIKNDSVAAKANYMGGDLQGVFDKISKGYFDSLNVNVLWLSPVYDNPDIAYQEYPAPHRWYSGYHGYWPVSPTKVETKFGNLELLKKVISEAHKHNIKILLDFVSNHVHKDHPYYKEHPEWFGNLKLPDGTLNLRFWDKYRLTTWFEPYLPSFDYLGSKEAVEAMTDNAIWWLKETKADGFRHDAVKHVPYVFWRRLTAKIKSKVAPERKVPVYQIGETFGSYELTSSYVNNGQLDAQFNFNLYDVALKVFLDSSASFELLDKEINKTFNVYGILNTMGNIMDSHDKSRYMAFADGDLKLGDPNAIEIGWNNPPQVDYPDSYEKSKLYLTYLFTIPGIPVIYYGSEFGMTGAGDPDNRRMMRFNEKLNKYEKQMLKDVRKITKLRKEHTALRYGDFYPLIADKNIYAYIRSDLNEKLLVVLNKSSKDKRITITIPKVYNIKSLIDLISKDTYKENNGKFKIEISGINGRVFLLE